METVSVDILNPSGLSLLKELEKLKLIAIHENEKTSVKSDDFMDLVRKIRKKSTAPLSLDEITAEVEQQRAEMYAVSE
ncbi:MAG: tellurite resistance TerB family protein [Tannerella sp.]|nr:tellurite resistance TerB family protein [Tannerella sp.]